MTPHEKVQLKNYIEKYGPMSSEEALQRAVGAEWQAKKIIDSWEFRSTKMYQLFMEDYALLLEKEEYQQKREATP